MAAPHRLRGLAVAALAGLALSACAYFNALYNARRFYGDGRRALERGDSAAAAGAFRSAIARAAASYRRDSTGRWSDEALELIGRSYFAVGDYGRARAALARLLERGATGERRAAAQAYLGAALTRSDQPAAARAPLDSAAARLGPRTELGAFARLWRARARFDALPVPAAADAPGAAGAWHDLDAAGAAAGALGVETCLEAMARSVALRDSAHAAGAFAAALARPDMAAHADSVKALARAAAVVWGPAAARALLGAHSVSSADPVSRWPASWRQDLALFRASLAAEAGDTATALGEADGVVRGSDRGAAIRARIAVARWRLAGARDLGAADAVRGELLPAIADVRAQQLVHALRVLDVLVERAQAGEPIALFAAGELARDQLAAPALARRLFVAYADLVPGAAWAPKALMAAALLASAAGQDSLRTRLGSYGASVYVRTRTTPADASAFADAETRLGRLLAGVGQAAVAEADRRDAGVSHAVAVLDSVRAAASRDSLRIACGAFADSVGIGGVRGDSLRAACVRRDSAKVALLLKPDTMKRADSAAVRGLPARRDPRAVARDTTN